MGIKLKTLGFLATVFSLLLLSAHAYAAETSVAADAAPQVETSYYNLVDPERYTLVHEVSLVNPTADPAYGIDVSVALMDKYTPLYTSRLREQLIPWPDSIVTDEYGRRRAYYHFDELPSGKSLLLTQKYVLECSGISYPGLSTAGQAGYEEQLASQYLLPSPGIESDNEEIINFAKQAAGKAQDTYSKAKAAFAAVNLYMTYTDVDWDSPNRGALLALHTAQGVCEDYSKLYVAVLRALGIAARQQSGYLYLPAQDNVPPYVDADGRIALDDLRHAWVEFYIPGRGWVEADPTFTYTFEVDGKPSKYINWNYFAGITKERRYIFFREESLNEDKMFKFTVANKVPVAGSVNAYLLPGSQAAYYNDLEGNWAADAIMRLSERAEPLLQGMGNGMFGVNEPMTRAQLVVCLQRVMKSPPAGAKFSDLSPSHWAYRDIGAAYQAGWIAGYPDGTFRPDKPVTRAELAQLLVAVFQLAPPDPVATEDATTTGSETATAGQEAKQGAPVDTEPQDAGSANTPPPVFLDLGQPGYAWADEAITTLYALGFAQGDGQGHFQPQRPVTRAECAVFLDRIITAQEAAN